MATVVYVGNTDVRVLTAADFKRLGVDGQNKVEFEVGVPEDVSDDAAKMLMERSDMAFNLVEDDEDVPPVQEIEVERNVTPAPDDIGPDARKKGSQAPADDSSSDAPSKTVKKATVKSDN